MLANPQVTKPLLELVLGAAVIISMEQTAEEALTKTARVNAEEIVGTIF